MPWKSAGASGVTCRRCSSTRKQGASKSPTIPAGRAACCSDNADTGAGKEMRTRRDFLKASASGLLLAGTARWVEFANGANDALPSGTIESAQLVSLPGKLPLIKRSFRPPNFETPVGYFNDAFTPNNAFFVRYHLAGIPEV